MIGVLARASDEAIVAELFELFKTPWEFYRTGHSYDAVLCTTTDTLASCPAKVLLVYGSDCLPLDAGFQVRCHSRKSQAVLLHGPDRIPIYGTCVFFEDESCSLIDEGSRMPAICRREQQGQVLIRVGYDLLDEVRRLLTEGQPAIFADSPSLDWHIAVLRELILDEGIALVEIPPLPAGYPFIACLTHDVDHPLMRRHMLDHTAVGFLYRALFSTPVKWLRRRAPLRDVIANWMAALRLPLVATGIATDPWASFAKHYAAIDGGASATYFVIPFRNRPGIGAKGGAAPAMRGAAYGAADLRKTLEDIRSAGHEVALHGIDAWADTDRGRMEFKEIRQIIGEADIGVRMHWLYFDQQSPARLDEASAIYDSTVGYRETAGYKSGTTQVYRPPSVKRLLELPMHAMDTALFSPACLGLSSEQATERLERMIDRAMELGGCLTLNWHDRSLGPERLWYRTYRETVASMKERGAWFATAGQAVAWFRKRRAVVFERESGSHKSGIRVNGEHAEGLPGLRLRIHEARNHGKEGSHRGEAYTERLFDQKLPADVPCLAK